ncbi:hypothetical protein DYY66_1674 [Candidatus Nitrosotalea sp. FS]|uniref:hypothetical protein n=1 Tax=Candidatus Nitrosotalea sp. FS TaxID=2341021 RepID=UPI00140CCB26|nr:hypothetical protein [Candidatus Nitrosotalea sp. FS]NHH97173.1 hypothetical protein [Candidatus Nitrosotalea sp. FS]
MKTLHLSILVGLGIVVTGLVLVFSQPHNPTFEERLGNPTQTWLSHNGTILILNQTSDKPEYKVGENITISTELINVGNKSVNVGYWPPLVVLEIKDQKGALVWPENTNLGIIEENYSVETIRPGEHLNEKPWGNGNFTNMSYEMPLPQLHVPGKYTVVSMALFTFNITTDSRGHREPTGLTTQLWSKPIQITVLP